MTRFVLTRRGAKDSSEEFLSRQRGPRCKSSAPGHYHSVRVLVCSTVSIYSLDAFAADTRRDSCKRRAQRASQNSIEVLCRENGMLARVVCRQRDRADARSSLNLAIIGRRRRTIECHDIGRPFGQILPPRCPASIDTVFALGIRSTDRFLVRPVHHGPSN